MDSENDNQNVTSVGANFCSLVSNCVFVGLCLTLTGIYFVVTGIQYWMPSYMKNTLGTTEDMGATVYMVLTFSGPISGVIVGGVATSYLGGYNTKGGQIIQCVFGLLAVACAAPIAFFPSLTGFAIFMWLLLFFGGAVVPPVTGIMLNSVPEMQRTAASSIA